MAGVAGIAEDGSTGCETNPGAADAGAGAGTPCPITVARQSSQYNTSRTGREHAEHIGLPQFLQYPVASTSVWTAHFIEFSLPSTHCELIAHEQSELAARDKAEFAAEEGNFLGQHLEL
jgi:hypothetical protein